MENNKAFTFIDSGKVSPFFIVIGGSCQPITSIERIEKISVTS
jgi:hypothetical protein